MERLIEQLSGYGNVAHEEGTLVRPMRYAISVYQRFDQGVPGQLRIEGHVFLEDTEGLTLVGENLTLTLHDGRVLDFVIQNKDGRIAVRGQRFTSARASKR